MFPLRLTMRLDSPGPLFAVLRSSVLRGFTVGVQLMIFSEASEPHHQLLKTRARIGNRFACSAAPLGSRFGPDCKISRRYSFVPNTCSKLEVALALAAFRLLHQPVRQSSSVCSSQDRYMWTTSAVEEQLLCQLLREKFVSDE